jgi:hypothetical protein
MSLAIPPQIENTNRSSCKMSGSDQQPNQWFEAVKNGSLKELYDLLQQGEHIRQVDETG